MLQPFGRGLCQEYVGLAVFVPSRLLILTLID